MAKKQQNPDIRIIIRHLSGSKTNQVDEFPLAQFKEVLFGRSASTDMPFDPEIDDMVSREHGKIMVESVDPLRISIVDLGSSNGILVNKADVKGSIFLYPGDIIQLGSTGPEFQFDVEEQKPTEPGAPPRERFEGPKPAPGAAAADVNLTGRSGNNTAIIVRLSLTPVSKTATLESGGQ